MVTQGDRIVEYLRSHPGSHHRQEIAEGTGLTLSQIGVAMVPPAKQGLIRHGPKRGEWEAVFPDDLTPAPVEPANGHSNGNQLPETLSFHVVGLLSDNRIVLE